MRTLSYITAAAFFLFAAAFPSTVSADGAVRPISLDQCIRTALEHNRTLQSEAENVKAAKAAVGIAVSGFLPRVNLSETYMRSDNPVMAFGSKLNQGRFTAADFAVDKLNGPDPIDNFNFRAEVVLPVFNGGKEAVGYRRSKLGLASAEKGLERVRQETVFQVVRAYYGVLLADEYVKVADKALDTTGSHLKTAQDFYAQGMLIGSEVLLARVRLAEVKEMKIKAVNREKTAKAGLNLIMGTSLDTPVEACEPPLEEHVPAVLEDYLDEAPESRPDLAGMELSVRNMEAGVDMAKTGYLPNINFVGRYELDDDDPFGAGGESYTLMGMLTWNVFDGFLTTNSVAEARAKYNAMSHMRDQMKEGVLFEVRRAYYNLLEAAERVDTADAAVSEGEEALRIIRRRFEAGMTKTLDVLDAETALTRARTNRAEALYDKNVARAELDLAAGRIGY